MTSPRLLCSLWKCSLWDKPAGCHGKWNSSNPWRGPMGLNARAPATANTDPPALCLSHLRSKSSSPRQAFGCPQPRLQPDGSLRRGPEPKQHNYAAPKSLTSENMRRINTAVWLPNLEVQFQRWHQYWMSFCHLALLCCVWFQRGHLSSRQTGSSSSHSSAFPFPNPAGKVW